MTKLKQKNLKFDADTLALLADLERETGASGARCASIALSLYAVSIGVEVRRARQFLYDNLIQMVITERLHHPGGKHDGKVFADDLKLRRDASRNIHQKRGGVKPTKV